VIKRSLALVALAGLSALPACTAGQAAAPPYTPANVGAQYKLQFAVGTANLNGTPALNTVVTLRSSTGTSILASTPQITLPFTNTAPASAAGNDSGTTFISGATQVPSGQTAPPTTFGTAVGAFAYGFLASNSSQTGANNSIFYPTTNRMPYYAATRRAYYVGPGNAFVPNFKDGSLGTAFNGYPSGFTTFALAPQTGSYALNVAIPGNNVSVPNLTATTSLTSTALLGLMPTPVYTSNGAGGGTVAVTVPAGVTETLVFINDTDAGTFYTLVIRGTGPQTATLASNLGVVTGGVAGPSVPVGNHVRVIAVGFDYPAIEAVPVGLNPPQAPVIANGSGQANITVSTASPALVTE
jgi:hypothetical protein